MISKHEDDELKKVGNSPPDSFISNLLSSGTVFFASKAKDYEYDYTRFSIIPTIIFMLVILILFVLLYFIIVPWALNMLDSFKVKNPTFESAVKSTTDRMFKSNQQQQGKKDKTFAEKIQTKQPNVTPPTIGKEFATNARTSREQGVQPQPPTQQTFYDTTSRLSTDRTISNTSTESTITKFLGNRNKDIGNVEIPAKEGYYKKNKNKYRNRRK